MGSVLEAFERIEKAMAPARELGERIEKAMAPARELGERFQKAAALGRELQEREDRTTERMRRLIAGDEPETQEALASQESATWYCINGDTREVFEGTRSGRQVRLGDYLITLDRARVDDETDHQAHEGPAGPVG